MKFPGNCFLIALAAQIFGFGIICSMRNASGRVHFYWLDRNGLAHEFYTKGASRRPYWRNALTLGEIRRCPSLDGWKRTDGGNAA